MTEARKDVLSWHDTFMLMAHLISQRSKDPNTQVGAVIVDENNVVLGMGYNGWPRGIATNAFPWSRGSGYDKKDFLQTKYPYVVHAEVNAILNTNQSVKGSKMYCPVFPCNDCAKVIIQAGIKEVIYEEDKYPEVDIFVAAKRLFEAANVKYTHYKSTKKLVKR